jgi:hypothetical protein
MMDMVSHLKASRCGDARHMVPGEKGAWENWTYESFGSSDAETLIPKSAVLEMADGVVAHYFVGNEFLRPATTMHLML